MNKNRELDIFADKITQEEQYERGIRDISDKWYKIRKKVLERRL